jgi:dihydropteroate synthase
MGVLNVTPDSFSDGGLLNDASAAAAAAESMVAGGADLIDIGGESTRPGAGRVSEVEQIARIIPVLKRLSQFSTAISVDTTRMAVALAALDAGASIINDISAGRDDPGILDLAAARSSPVILMHMKGAPADMQIEPRYRDVTAEVGEFLRERLAAAEAAGIAPDHVLLDPGIGFGKTVRHNLELLRRLTDLARIGRPLVVGTSRKSFIGVITGENQPRQRLFGTAATIAWSIANGAAIVRVHDVGEMSRVVRMIYAIQSGAENSMQ